MANPMDNPVFKLFALVSALHVIQLLLLASWTGITRTLSKTWVNPEDTKFLGGRQVESDVEKVQRTKRAHLNAIENAVPFFIVGLLYVLTGASESGAKIYFWTFFAARVVHSISYLAAIQPFRTLSFGVGALAVFGMAVQVVMAVM